MRMHYLTSGQVARLLGVSKGTILRAVQRGELRAASRMPGGSLRFLVADVDAYSQRLRTALSRRVPESGGAAAISASSHGLQGRATGQPLAAGASIVNHL